MRPLKVGITGGIGSGKSTVCYIFETIGVPVYYSDLRARKLINSNSSIIKTYKRIFGDDIYSDGELDRKRVAEILFKDRGLVKEINKIVHPVIRADFQIWASKQTAPYVLNEAAVLFEGGGYKYMDFIITVSAPEEIRVSRVINRDSSSTKTVKERIDNQWSDKERTDKSDFVLYADDKQLIVPQVLNLHKILLNMS
ncbi:dephospho-CoA kinase [Marinilabiliaceae bacterium ANBcel2]|nr:dephospho-CoA kinase [Marinilabiliaceae bacterium ANBcel2]